MKLTLTKSCCDRLLSTRGIELDADFKEAIMNAVGLDYENWSADATIINLKVFIGNRDIWVKVRKFTDDEYGIVNLTIWRKKREQKAATSDGYHRGI